MRTTPLALVCASTSTTATTPAGSDPDPLDCSGEVGLPCANPAHGGAVLELDLVTFGLACAQGKQIRALGTGTCVECGEPHSITQLLAPNAGLVEGVLNGAITAKLGLPSAWPEVLKKFITTCFAMVQRGGTQHLCVTCAEPGMSALARTGGYQDRDGVRVPPFVAAYVPVEGAPPAPPPPVLVQKPAPPPPSSRVASGPDVTTAKVVAPAPRPMLRTYSTLQELVSALMAGTLQWRKGVDGLTQCVVNLNAPNLCTCNGHHDWETMPAFAAPTNGKPKYLGVGPACAEMIDAFLREKSHEPIFAGAQSLAQAVLGEKYRAPSRMTGAAPEVPRRLLTAEEVAEANRERAKREAKRAAQAEKDRLRRKMMRGKHDGGGGKPKGGK